MPLPKSNKLFPSISTWSIIMVSLVLRDHTSQHIGSWDRFDFFFFFFYLCSQTPFPVWYWKECKITNTNTVMSSSRIWNPTTDFYLLNQTNYVHSSIHEHNLAINSRFHHTRLWKNNSTRNNKPPSFLNNVFFTQPKEKNTLTITSYMKSQLK